MFWRAFCIAVLLLLVSPVSAWATTAAPSSPPSIDDVHVYRHLLEPNDFLVIARYNIPYTSIPDARVDQAFLFRLLATDKNTMLLSNEAYAYHTNGYGDGVIAFYADNTSAPTWGLGYTIQITGKPSEFADPASVTWNFPISTGAYSSLIPQSANQLDLADKIVGMAQILELEWSTTLLSVNDAGIILSTSGQIYFQNAILGVRLMAPTLFAIQVADPNYATTNWTNAQATTYRTRFTGTWWGNAVQAVADLFGMSFFFWASMPLLVVSIFCMVVAGQQGNIMSGLLNILAVGMYGALIGWTPFFILSIGSILIAAYTAYIWFLKNTG